MIRKRLATHCLIPPAACLLLFSTLTPAVSGQKLSEDDRVEILRGMLSEYATVKAFLPRSKKPLPFDASGQLRQTILGPGRPAVRSGRAGGGSGADHARGYRKQPDRARDQQRHEGQRNGKLARSRADRHGRAGHVAPINRQQNSNAPSGTSIALLFGGPVPELKADEIKKMMAPVLDFDKAERHR